MYMNPTTWQLYTDNPVTWSAMLKACEEAKESIDLENFIFTPDVIGNQFIEVCTRKASEGVKVRFIWDAAGSFTFFSSSIIDELKQKGIELVFFKTLIPSVFKFHKYRSWYFRNHRRTLIVDKKLAFTGSVSISERMVQWRDTSVQIEGPVVNDMQESFERMWMRAQGKRLPKVKKVKRSDREFEYVTTMPIPRKHQLYGRLIDAIRSAEKSIYITVPYFVPTHRLVRVLYLAAHRGVDVQIILPQESDFPLVDLAARTYFHHLLKVGIKIYLYKEKMIHAKSVVIDGNWATMGTLNLDHISLLYNFEANIVTNNKHFADELTEHFQEDLKHTEEVTLGEWNQRFFVEKIATFLVKLIRVFL